MEKIVVTFVPLHFKIARTLKLRLLSLLIYTTAFTGWTQEFPRDYFRAPLDIPLYLSGNFGELRSNHYHSGVDFKTQGRQGLKVFAAAEGFVSRIKVSPYGYGNALYIDHPNGYTTVYGHLQCFSPKIDSLVKNYQYKKKSFAIDEILPAKIFKIKKGEVVALSGNSGSSGGPHLHFEIRETATEFPTNPLLYGFDIKDEVAPVIRSLFVYDMNAKETGENKQRKQYNLVKQGNGYVIKGGEEPIVSGKFRIALDTRDYMSTTHNYYGIYKLSFYVDGELKHRFTFDKFSFAESRYINAHIDYELYKTQKRRVHKLFHEANQKESFADVINTGILFSDNKRHSIKVLIEDAYGNNVDLRFKVKSEPITQKSNFANGQEFLNYSQVNRVEAKDFFAQIPAMTLYKNTLKKDVSTTICDRKDSYSHLYHFFEETVPLHKHITVGVKPKQMPKTLKDRAFLARKNGKLYRFVGNTWKEGFLTGSTRNTGDFVVLIDTVAPQIRLWKGRSYRKTGKLRYKIKDNLSGITSYRGLIDGKWALFEYDAKRRLLQYTLSTKRIRKGQKHKLVLKVTDACGNVATRKAFFTW